ncbi:MAG TPA: hypothetical protein VMR25_02520, partial [Planctomycetaceae bacterium]|nr:hypothetical protein [Planctomycetaceae bacterium]
SSGPVRDPDDVTGFDAHDDFALNELRIGPVTNPPGIPPEEEKHGYWGPFPLINTALNLVAGDQLAWQERRAESFVLSPLYCGANSVGYRDTREYSAGKLTPGKPRKLKPLTLGRSVAISGAAASPNMGYHSSPAPAALMTIFNVRLGWWLPNPKKAAVFTSNGPGSGLQWLLCELFGYTNTKRDFVNISDGGHFENLGVYELVRRRCRFIVVADGGADPDFEFEDLAGLIRKCRSDFGIDIEIDVSQLRRRDGKHSDVHCAIGTIRYDYVEPTAPVGTLIYLKPSLTGDESADIQYYAGKHPDFPHQPTLDQFFNESQFESYRALGYHCASKVFGPAVERLHSSPVTSPKPDQAWIQSHKDKPPALLKKARACHDFEAENLFYQLRKEWLAAPNEFEAGFLQSVEGYEDLQKDLAADPRLAKIDPDLYPELKSRFCEPERHLIYEENYRDTTADEPAVAGSDGKTQDNPSVELHTASRMLQVMENAFLGSQMNLFYAHPLNAGWMNVFQRWGNWPALRRYWPLLRNEYSRDFVRFCERKLALKSEVTADPITIERLIQESPKREKSWLQVCQEFDAEWPADPTGGGPPRLKQFHDQAWQSSDGKKAFYCLLVGSKGEPDSKKIQDGFIGGVLALRELKPDECPGVSPSDGDKFVLWTTESTTGYELLVWVRPAFRQQSIGTQLIERLFALLYTREEDPAELARKLGNGKTVRISVLYPRRGWSGNGGDDMEKMMWLSFFSFYGFRRPSPGCPHSKAYEVLTLEIAP